jgi:hypothetical protein
MYTSHSVTVAVAEEPGEVLVAGQAAGGLVVTEVVPPESIDATAMKDTATMTKEIQDDSN